MEEKSNSRGMGTAELFEHLVNSPYLWSLTGLPHSQRTQAVYRLKNNIGISLDKKEELLAKAGFIVEQEKTWKPPRGIRLVG